MRKANRDEHGRVFFFCDLRSFIHPSEHNLMITIGQFQLSFGFIRIEEETENTGYNNELEIAFTVWHKVFYLCNRNYREWHFA
ncbi:MAG TPA: hypothetical protein VGD17_03735 [Chitinophagaceae bacterium]